MDFGEPGVRVEAPQKVGRNVSAWGYAALIGAGVDLVVKAAPLVYRGQDLRLDDLIDSFGAPDIALALGTTIAVKAGYNLIQRVRRYER